jgi:hypothetical protein
VLRQSLKTLFDGAVLIEPHGVAPLGPIKELIVEKLDIESIWQVCSFVIIIIIIIFMCKMVDLIHLHLFIYLFILGIRTERQTAIEMGKRYNSGSYRPRC